MEKCQNGTIREFYILSISTSETGRYLFFICLLFTYLWTLTGNALITALICVEARLHTPMYFFLGNLSVADVIYASTYLPKLLLITATGDNRIWFSSCIAQVSSYMLFGITDILILTFMSYDRYVAICMSLQYHRIMNKQVYTRMSISSWVTGVVNSGLNAFLTSKLIFCDKREINQIFCDIKALYLISSSDTSSRKRFLLLGCIGFTLVTLCIIVTSYAFVINSILKIRSSKGRAKAFSSCTSHLTTVILFYGSILSVYGDPGTGSSNNQDKVISLVFITVVPVLNPVVYTLRNNDVLGAIQKVARDIKHS